MGSDDEGVRDFMGLLEQAIGDGDMDEAERQSRLGVILLVRGLSQINQCSGVSAALLAVRTILSDLVEVDGSQLADILRCYADWAETDDDDELAAIEGEREVLTATFFQTYDLKFRDAKGSA